MTTRSLLHPLFALLLLWGCGTAGTRDGDDPGSKEPAATASPADEVTYACPMHPEVTGKKGDTCSRCGMDLEPAVQGEP